MRGRAGDWRAHVVLVALSTGLTLALVEGAARVLLRPEPAEPLDGTPISQLSSTLGWTTLPSGWQRIRRPDFEVTVSINSRGLRGPDLPYQAAPGRRRLAIMGDSFAHGYYAEEPETLRGRLAVALRACQVDVLNAGSPGYSTDQEWLYFDEEIQKYDSREVVLLFYYNDLLFNVEGIGTANREKPFFLEKEGSLELVPPSFRTPVGPAIEDSPTPARNAPVFRHSALWAFLAARLQRSRPDWSRALSGHGLVPEFSATPPAEYLPFGPADAGERSRVEQMWRVTTLILRRFRDDVRGRGAGISVFYVPARFEVNDEAWTFLQRRYEADRPWKREAVSGRLASELKSLDIPLIDAMTGFQAAEGSARKAYLAIDGHWNGRGNEIAFESLLPMMRRAFSCAS
ncbi:MAG: SGNH/GDSL hydrolase family protein [Vicinamibacteria bacterium]|nr:SGNH/GDSL hydrolase family protein [Vicinamibacteria bacterium]